MTENQRNDVLDSACNGNTLTLDFGKHTKGLCITCMDEGFISVDEDGFENYLTITYRNLRTGIAIAGCFEHAIKEARFFQKHGQVPCVHCA